MFFFKSILTNCLFRVLQNNNKKGEHVGITLRYISQTYDGKNVSEVFEVGIHYYNTETIIMSDFTCTTSTYDLKYYYRLNPILSLYLSANCRLNYRNNNYYIPNSGYRFTEC